MAKPPLCRYCGRPIRRRTSRLYFSTEAERKTYPQSEISDRRSFGPIPRNKAEAQQRTNLQVVAVSYGAWGPGRPVDEELIRSVTTWDGESYVDQFFCNGDHAKAFARVMAKAGHATRAYEKAVQQQEDKNG